MRYHWFSPVLLLTLLSCGHHTPETPPVDPVQLRQLPPEFQAEAASLVAGNTAFALDLYNQIRRTPGNLVLSPYSISTALAMTWAGARTETATEMASVLHFSAGQPRLHSLFGALQKSLDTGVGLRGYRLDIANRLWGQQGRAWLTPFLTLTREQYGAELQPLDFWQNTEGSRQTINAWVSQRTAGEIPQLLAPGSLDPNTQLVLTNAIYFKGTWQTRFDAALTTNAAFQLEDGSSVQVPFMHQNASFAAANLATVRLVELPFKGADIVMVFLVPASGRSLGDLEAELSPARLTEWFAAMHEGTISLALPRFRYSAAFGLKEDLSKMGMSRAFEPAQADFSGMDGNGNLFLAAAVHKARVAVDEEGATAAAATGILVGPTAALPLNLDRPFLFFIRDKVTGSILFLGRVADPSRMD
jgi:serpin B